ncbi:MAG: bifunctional UDP-N-acetylmuramoyl-tripeptide:D-alanyl-D-alanine ligase/alanine racemase [Salinivirgaceae bacterium]|jgi:alanine racemase|nr:bifunctional UDP-N-acetylmuramoyl-tripeptide:D-alanyl-D-alanine ligase/alanine racemase [Bacteroidales bacterium]
MRYILENIAEITNGTLYGNSKIEVETLLIDSRSLKFTKSVMFIALSGDSGNGHKYIRDLIEKGVKAFLVESLPQDIDFDGDIGFVVVENSLESLQKIAIYHRNNFSFPIVGITGSNGKTIVKEWLNFCLQDKYTITRSPKSYNSQIGVPLSVWELNDQTEVGIFEAGMSQPNEMGKLAEIIKPNIGIFTNIGDAHQENFQNHEQKLREKLLLFKYSEKVITSSENGEVVDVFRSTYPDKELITWGYSNSDRVKIVSKTNVANGQKVVAEFNNSELQFTIQFLDGASFQNAMNVVTFMSVWGYRASEIAEKIGQLQAVDMRLEIKAGRRNCTIINDSYNSDLVSLSTSLEYLAAQNQVEHKMVVVSDILQSGLPHKELYQKVADMVKFHSIDKFIGVGNHILQYRHLFSENSLFFPNTDNLIEYFDKFPPSNSVILLKGSRTFRFERVDRMLQERRHRTIMEVNLDALISNLRYFRSTLNKDTKVIAMLKAFGYGSGSHELATVLQHHRVDYLAVAFTDEAVQLRESGIKTPIMVMNPGIETFPEIVEYNLGPEVFGFDFLENFNNYLAKISIQNYPIHIKIDSGMNRSGFKPFEIEKLCKVLKNFKNVRVMSVFSHLAAADDPQFDSFTLQQIADFKQISERISAELNYSFFRHILNTAGTERFPQFQFDAVRLGIGLYGISFENNPSIKQVVTLRSQIMQIKEIEANETVGYSRKGVVNRKSTIATIPIGYADGYRRILGNGKGKMLVNGKIAYTIGNICMDMCMLDVTGLDAKEGDEVLIFGEDLPIYEIAESMGTIPYEVLTGISSRIKRVYYRE